MKLTDIDSYKYHWGLGEAYRLKGEGCLDPNKKKNIMEKSIGYYSIVQQQQIPEEMKSDFFADFANVYVEYLKFTLIQLPKQSCLVPCLF